MPFALRYELSKKEMDHRSRRGRTSRQQDESCVIDLSLV